MEIQHFTIHDGPGIRSTVFLKGCQLRCLWCHNPESVLHDKGNLAFLASKCVGCGTCIKVCPQKAHVMENGVHRLDRNTCVLCGKCAQFCAGDALAVNVTTMSPQHVADEVLRDVSYYRESGGGVTLSGGEAMLQRQFVRELIDILKQHDIHITIETNLSYPYQWLDEIRNKVDLFLVDWKESDEQRHKEYTGAGNQQIYENICQLHKDGHKVLLRCPIIPGYNDREDHFRRIAELTQEFPDLIGAELLPYHAMGVGKIEKFGLEGELSYIVAEEPAKETVARWLEQCREFGGRMVNQ